MRQKVQQAYLEAMGIEVWVARDSAQHEPLAEPAVVAATRPEPESPAPVPMEHPAETEWPAATGALLIGPGTGNTLLVCSNAEEAATPLAADICRCLAVEPVWAWPATSSTPEEQAMPLAQAIKERLFTRILVFGAGLLDAELDSRTAVMSSARLIEAQTITTLRGSSAARKELWQLLVSNQWCGQT